MLCSVKGSEDEWDSGKTARVSSLRTEPLQLRERVERNGALDREETEREKRERRETSPQQRGKSGINTVSYALIRVNFASTLNCDFFWLSDDINCTEGKRETTRVSVGFLFSGSNGV